MKMKMCDECGYKLDNGYAESETKCGACASISCPCGNSDEWTKNGFYCGECMKQTEGYLEEMVLFHADLEKVAGNGETIKLGDDNRYTDSAGAYGYRTHFTGAYVCYTCGHLCECE